jgi:fructoselysine 6-kinase
VPVRICGVGDNVVDRYLELGLMFPGGNTLNVAVFAKRAGAEAAYLGITGNDVLGEIVRRALAAEGIDTARLRVNDSFNAFSQIGIDLEGNRYFIGSTPPPYRLRLDTEDLAYLTRFDVVHTGDYGQIEGQLAEIAAVASVSFDFGSKPASYAELLLPQVRIATFSGSELDDAAVLERIRWAQARGARTVIVTRGALGSTVAHGPDIHHEPARPVVLRDSLGAGDAYTATLIVGLESGRPLAQAARAAAEAAGEVCTRLGAFGYGVPMTPLPVAASA